MKYLYILLVFAFMACSTNNDQNADSESTAEVVAVEKVAPEVDSVIVVEEVMVNESDIDQDAAVEAAFMNIVEVMNTIDGSNPGQVSDLLDKDYVFKGKNLEESTARYVSQFKIFQTNISNVQIQSIESSCDLAYLIVSFQKTITKRATSEIVVDARDKVGLFIMRKNANDKWKLLVQKTDDGFAHWFYMPQAN